MPHARRDAARQNDGVRFARALVGVGLALGACVDAPDLRPVEPGPGSPADDAGAPTEETGASATCGESCIAAGGTCEGDVCAIRCGTGGTCMKAKVRCPDGVACDIACIDKDACESVKCGPASTCTITCRGARACTANVEANASTSSITCDGAEACNNDVVCRGESCAVTCASGGCKPGAVRCCAQSCTVNGAPATCAK